MVRRLEFDALLLELARDAGAEVVEGVEVSRARETQDVVLDRRARRPRVRGAAR